MIGFIEDYTNIFSLRMSCGVPVVLYVARHCSVDGMITALRRQSRQPSWNTLPMSIMLTMKHPSPANHSVPRCRKRILPGTTYSPPVFFAPNRFPGPSFAPLALPCA